MPGRSTAAGPKSRRPGRSASAAGGAARPLRRTATLAKKMQHVRSYIDSSCDISEGTSFREVRHAGGVGADGGAAKQRRGFGAAGGQAGPSRHGGSSTQRGAKLGSPVVHGLRRSARDMYFFVVSMTWPRLVGGCLAVLLLVIVFFALLFYWCVARCVVWCGVLL